LLKALTWKKHVFTTKEICALNERSLSRTTPRDLTEEANWKKKPD
jgi:hypothetical protein